MTRSDIIWSLVKRLNRLDLITSMQMDRFDERLNAISSMWYGQLSDDETEWLLCIKLGGIDEENMKEIDQMLDRLYHNVKKFDTQ